MDELKKYFQDNREHIDTDLPGEGLWKGVQNRLHPSPAITPLVKWLAAACLVLAVGTGAYFFTHPAKKILAAGPSNGKPSETASIDTIAGEKKNVKEGSILPATITKEPVITHKKKTTQNTDAMASRKTRKAKPVPQTVPLYGFEGIEASYATMLDIQLERVRTQPIYAEDAGYFHLFKEQFANLAKDEEQIKRQLKQNPYDESLLDELITVYQRKIAILKQLQFEINKMNNKVKQTNAGIPLQKPSYINL